MPISKPVLEEYAPLTADNIPPDAYDNDRDGLDFDTLSLWDTVDSIYLRATDRYECDADADAWSSDVGMPLMHYALGPARDAFFEATNMYVRSGRCPKSKVATFTYHICSEHQSIDPKFLPVTPGDLLLTTRVTFAWAFSKHDPGVAPYYEAMRAKGIHLSPMTDSWTTRLLLYCGGVVKAPGGHQKALAQLALWLAAGLRQRNRIREIIIKALEEAETGQAKAKKLKKQDSEEAGNGEDEPLIGWIVDGHQWSFYLAWLSDTEAECTVCAAPSLEDDHSC